MMRMRAFPLATMLRWQMLGWLVSGATWPLLPTHYGINPPHTL